MESTQSSSKLKHPTDSRRRLKSRESRRSQTVTQVDNWATQADPGLSGAVRQLELQLRGHVILVVRSIRFGLVFPGGPIELEQMDSADPPLAVHGLYGGRHRQHRGNSTEEVQHRGGPLGSGPARLPLFRRSVLVRVAVCQQVAP